MHDREYTSQISDLWCWQYVCVLKPNRYRRSFSTAKLYSLPHDTHVTLSGKWKILLVFCDADMFRVIVHRLVKSKHQFLSVDVKLKLYQREVIWKFRKSNIRIRNAQFFTNLGCMRDILVYSNRKFVACEVGKSLPQNHGFDQKWRFSRILQSWELNLGKAL